MFNKRGIGSEIDWILGVGLFILSVTFIFILFKPGIVPLQDSETLLDILQNGFDGYSNWEIIRVPIFIAPIYLDYEGRSGSVRLTAGSHPDSLAENNYYDQLSGIIDDRGEQYMKVFYVLRDNTDSAPGEIGQADVAGELSDSEIDELCRRDFDDAIPREGEWSEFRSEENLCMAESTARGRARHDLIEYNPGSTPDPPDPGTGPVEISAEANNQINFNLIDSELVIPSELDSTKTKYFLVVSDRPINFVFSDDLGTGFVGCYYYSEDGTRLSGPTEFLPIGGLEDGACQVVYELGAREILNGIDYSYLIGLVDFDNSGGCTNPGYECVKEVWGFPAARDFMIEVESIPERTGGAGECDSSSEQLCYRFPRDSPGPSANQNTFVRQYTRFILSDDGEKIPVIVRLTVW